MALTDAELESIFKRWGPIGALKFRPHAQPPPPDPAGEDEYVPGADPELDAFVAEIMAGADALEYQDAAPEPELAGAGLSNATQAMGRMLAGQAARQGDIETAIGLHLELSNGGTGTGSIELANGPRGSYGGYARPCGSLDDFGRCAEPYHQVGCGAVLEGEAATGSAESAAAWNDVLAYRAAMPAIDSAGRPWLTQHGDAATMADFIEASAGQRTRRFSEFGLRDDHEVAGIDPVAMYGDPSDPGSGVPLHRAGVAGQMLREHPELLAASPDQIRARGRAAAGRAEAERALRSAGRGVHPDFAESPRERAGRLSQPAELIPAGDGWNGAVVPYGVR